MAKTPKLPDPIDRSSQPYILESEGWWLVLSDTHFPFHDNSTIELAIKEAIKYKVAGVLLNGDILDFHELSRFDKTPDDPRYTSEIGMGREFLRWLRHKLPKARIVYKDGNHEERLYSYLCNKAPALFGLDVLTIPNLLQFENFGIEHVSERRVIKAGRLHIIHGHEYRPNIQAPVNPARGLFLRAKSVALTSHFHQTSEHHEPTISGKAQGAWSIGCACNLSPRYMSLNKWNLGFALVEIKSDGDFAVTNLRNIGGKIF